MPNHKAVCFSLWSPHHNNLRYAELFPKLSSVLQHSKVTLSRHRVLRGLQYRLWSAIGERIICPIAVRYLSRKYDTLLTVSVDQVGSWSRKQSVVVDMDDPLFTRAEVVALNLPQVKAIVVTTERAKQRFQELGVNRPIHVIPQGVSVGETDPKTIRAIAQRFKTDDDVIVGYHAPSLTMFADGSKRARNGQDDLDFLFATLEDARKIAPWIKLWLFGDPSDALKKHVRRGRESWAKLFGYVPFFEMLHYLANVDIGVYPRTWIPPPARFSVKIAQFMACGVPVVSRDLDESFVIKDANCGVVCQSQSDFAQALVNLAQSDEMRSVLGNAGRAYAERNLNWSTLVPIYKEILMG